MNHVKIEHASVYGEETCCKMKYIAAFKNSAL